MQKKIVQEILQIIYNSFRENGGTWPTFDHVERILNRYAKTNAVAILNRIPSTLIKPIELTDGRPSPTGQIILSVEGIAVCRGSDDDVSNFIAAVQWMVRRESNYDSAPPRASSGVPLSAAALAEDLAMPLVSDPKSIDRLIALLRAEGLVSDQ